MSSVTIDKVFHRLAVKWAAIGFGLALLFATVSAFYVVKNFSEKQIETLAKSSALAFRPFVIDGHVREAQLQLKEALSLKEDESAIILGPNLKPILPISDSVNEVALCQPEQKYCWPKDFRFIERLEPIYFDSEGKELFGYLDLKKGTEVDVRLVVVALLVLLVAFIIQAFGLISALNSAAGDIGIRLTNWTRLLKNQNQDQKIGFSEKKTNLISLRNAADDLNSEIEKMKEIAVDEARTVAQISLLKEISHDLKTPLSQMLKFFSVFVSEVRKKTDVNEELITHIQTTISRMREITQQAGFLLHDIDPDKCECDLESETKRILDELSHDNEVLSKKISFAFTMEGTMQPARITPTGYYRIIENLIRNSIHAVDPGGKVTVNLSNRAGRIYASVRDNGSGIPIQIQKRIFDFDFSTKPGKGSGMGLGIVRSLCSVFRAELNFESEVGKGTEFILTFLPVVRSNVV